MSNRRDLKAFIRYDATGRVISGSLILQRSKPKVGDWKQIDAYECCNPTTSTSSTTSTTTTVLPYPLNVCITINSESIYETLFFGGVLDSYPLYSDLVSNITLTYTGTEWFITGSLGLLSVTSDPTTSFDPSTAVWPEGVTVTSGACPSFSIGDYALGGVIAYILEEGDPGYDADVQHGLVVNISYDGSGRTPATVGWGCYGDNLSGATGTAIGTGPQNTLDILAGCSDPDIAAYICTHLNDYGSDEGYTDWYLPSINEVTKIWENRTASNLTIGLGNKFWSSTEYGSIEAYIINGGNGFTEFIDKTSSSNMYVWATRSF